MKPTDPLRNKHRPRTASQHRAHALFEEACAHLDDTTLARLRAARLQAVSSPHKRSLLPVLLPAGALAAGVLTLVVAWRPLHTPRTVMTAANPAPVSANGREIDMAQNLDFYDWLASQPQSEPAIPASAQ